MLHSLKSLPTAAQCRKPELFSSKASKLFPGYAQELQAEFNQEFLETLHQIELDDWGRYGEIRQKREKYISRDPDDERKKELAKQGKKPRR